MTKALDLLLALADSGRPLRLAEISKAVGLHRATAYRSLLQLQEQKFVMRDVEERWMLGPAVLRLADARAGKPTLSAIARPILEGLASDTGLMANAQVLETGGTRVIESVRPPRFSRILDFGGELLSATKAAGGLAMLAYLSPEERAGYLSATVELPSLIEAQLSQIRADGFAVTSGTFDDIMCSIACPVLSRSDRPVCAIVLVGLTAEFDGSKVQQAKAKLLAASDSFIEATNSEL